MNKLTIITNAFEPDAAKRASYECENIVEFMKTQFDRFPQNAFIYHESILPECDVTPKDQDGIDRLLKLSGQFYLVLFPCGLEIAFLAGLALATYVAVKLLAPKLPEIPAARNIQAGSPNNDLSARSNRARINGRIPDIFGEQISTPDLIALPYTIYDDDSREIEYAYMCVGRGEHAVLADDIKDNTTRLSEIVGSSAEVYGPFTSPNSGAPQLTVGDPIAEPVLYTKRTDAVNGQALIPTNSEFLSYPTGINFVAPNTIHRTSGAAFTDIFAAADTIVVTTSDRMEYRDGPGPDYYPVFVSYNLSGTYTITSVTADDIVLSSPEAVNAAWTTGLVDGGYGGGTYGDTNATLELDAVGANWVGPFMMDFVEMTNFIANFVSPQGMFKDDGTTQTSTSVEVQLGLVPVDVAGSATGGESFFNTTVVGSASERTQKAVTLRAPSPLTPSRYKVRARRLTPRDGAFSGQVADEVRWKDFYGVASVNVTDFGNVTTIQSKTVATTGALSVKDRKLNLRVQRKIIVVSEATPTTHTFGLSTTPTSKMRDILIAVCLDPMIGNRTENEINFYEIIQVANDAESYFETTLATQFNYTFDKDNISFEETVNAICGAAHCIGFRRGNVITIAFEKETTQSKLSFNHRNKLPRSEKRTTAFGNEGDFDGIEFEYVSPVDQSNVTLYIPTDRSAVKAKRVSSIGIRDPLQAYFHAWRLYQKLLYQRVSVQFTATQEAELLIRNDRIYVADNTRPDTQDGEIKEKVGLIVKTSQPVIFEDGRTYVAFLQLTDGTVQAIAATEGADEYHMVLADEPSLALSLNPSNFALTTYILVADDDSRPLAFLVSDRSPSDKFTSDIKAINYDALYYAKDKDYADGTINEQGLITMTSGLAFVGGTVTLAANGTATGTGATEWANGAPISGVGARFWARVTRSGGASGVHFNLSGWQSLAAGVTYSATGGAGGCNGVLEIASDAGGLTIVATDTISVNNAI